MKFTHKNFDKLVNHNLNAWGFVVVPFDKAGLRCYAEGRELVLSIKDIAKAYCEAVDEYEFEWRFNYIVADAFKKSKIKEPPVKQEYEQMRFD